MGGGSGNKGYKGDDAENMCGTTLEPDPRYQGCCSNIFRPGKVLRDIIVGFLVVLAIAVVIAVLFVVCFYLIPDPEESTLALEESAFVGKPIEEETNFNVLPEVELTDDTRYDVRPDAVLESIRKEDGHMDHGDGHMDHGDGHADHGDGSLHQEEHHHMGLIPEPEPEPEPEHTDHDSMHKEGEMIHDHIPEGEMDPEHMHTADEVSHTDVEGEIIHEHTHTEDNILMEGARDHGNEGPAFAPSAPANDEVIEVIRAPSIESTPSDFMPTERTVVSVSTSESEGVMTPEVHESSSIPPLFETHGHHDDTETEVPEETPVAPIVEVEAPVLAPGEPLATEVVSAGSCRPRQLEMCSDLPYGFTSLPNWANDQNEKELNEGSLPFFRDVIVRSKCSPRARQYACGILEPPCNSDGSIVPPCRTFCRSVASTCQEFIISGFSLSDVFDCEKFPDSTDPSVCFDMTQEPCVGMEHRCGDGRCVASRLVCDGRVDCLDQSDEATCPNRVQDFSTAALPTNAAPNTETQTAFPSQEDEPIETTPEEIIEDATTEPLMVEETTIFEEETVTSPVCPELQCLDGTCLLLSQLNNGVNDCPDGTDEQDFGSLF